MSNPAFPQYRTKDGADEISTALDLLRRRDHDVFGYRQVLQRAEDLDRNPVLVFDPLQHHQHVYVAVVVSLTASQRTEEDDP